MTYQELVQARLANQSLVARKQSPLEVLSAFGAMQAQEFRPAKWALGIRTANATEQNIQELFNAGKILRTHMLRPTWHFVLPEDIVWIQALTAPRVHALNKYYYKQQGLDEATLTQSVVLLKKELKGRALTRADIKEVYAQHGIDASGLRIAYLIMFAELEAVICSGPMQGKQHTYMLISERAPHAKHLSHAAALRELTSRYFSTHGPATVKDFAWWSSLPVASIQQGIELASLSEATIDGATFYYKDLPDSAMALECSLLPIYDEYTVAYKERRPTTQLLAANQGTLDEEDLFYHLLAINGQVAGGWKWRFTKDACVILPKFIKPLTASQQNALDIAMQQLATFLEMPVSGKTRDA